MGRRQDESAYLAHLRPPSGILRLRRGRPQRTEDKDRPEAADHGQGCQGCQWQGRAS